MSFVRVTVTATAGSAPRDAGTQMLVFADRIEGTIGGGALEWDAMSHARQMLKDGRDADRRKMPLGPALGQCCGGSVTLDYLRDATLDVPADRQIWVYGAGHVGRALVAVLVGLPDVQVTWVDSAADRFPAPVPDGVNPLAAVDMARAASHAPARAEHLVMTYAHDIDLAICHAVLSQPHGSIGLIGSATKWSRFKHRLTALGHANDQISQIACPIGDPTLGKHPTQIAIGVAAAMITADSARQKDLTA